MTAGDFQSQVREFAVAAGKLPSVAVRALAIEAGERLVDKNPVGNPDLWQSAKTSDYLGVLNVPGDTFAFARKGYVGGFSKGQWIASFDEPARGVSPTVDADGSATKARNAKLIQDGKDDYPLIWLTNNAPYIERLEDGWSKQAPAGMLSATFVELEAIAQTLVDAIADEFNAGADPQ